jgi:hydroxymethylglutaryl-CoA synthase
MVGIDDLSFYSPSYYLDLADLAENRGIEYEKLSKGLGVLSSALPGSHEDAATMAANAALRLIEQNNLDPRKIGRIYVGTESSIDGAKPVASYVLGMLEQYFQVQFGSNCLRHCDALDMTFACVGAVDALLNTVDWVGASENRIGIVIATDYAKYELGSGGEYTQGAGAVALLVTNNPRLLAIDSTKTGVACKDVHDFHKPVRTFDKQTFINSILINLGIDLASVDADQIRDLNVEGAFSAGQQEIALHKITPLFDGHFSNQCYIDRVREAYQHFTSLGGSSLIEWRRVAFHLPYAFHGKRIFSELFYLESADNLRFKAELMEIAPDFASLDQARKLKIVAQTPMYKKYVSDKIANGQKASSEIGNMYTASVFMALASFLQTDFEEGKDMAGEIIGFCTYGSGSKGKVFQGTVQPQWKEAVEKWNSFRGL